MIDELDDKRKESRKTPRIKMHIPIKYRKLRAENGIKSGSSVSKNLSEGGISFRTSDFISMACKLIVEIDIPKFNKPIKAISKIAWIRKLISSDEYEIGSQFIEMTKEDKALLSEYMQSLNI